MPRMKSTHTYEVQPEETLGKLTGLRIEHWVREDRVSDNDRVLDRGVARRVNEIEIPISKVSDLVRELAYWPIWYATTNPEDR